MQDNMTPQHIIKTMRDKFSIPLPLFLPPDKASIKLEMKPYLQPFERLLAMRELQALLDSDDTVTEVHGYHLATTKKSVDFLRLRLTYWQRLGRTGFKTTTQTTLEFTQNGFSAGQEKKPLHNARRLRYGTHDLHEYRGKFFPQLVRSLINISGIPDNAIVLDPMCGSGTTPAEVIASGRSSLSADLNPLSVLLSTVKAELILEDPKVFYETVSFTLGHFRFIKVRPESIWSPEDLNYLSRWFDPNAITDLASLRTAIDKVDSPLYRNFFNVCLSNVVRSSSWQKETDLRVRKEIRPYVHGAAIEHFREQASEQLGRIYPYLCVLPRSTPRPRPTVRCANAVNIADAFPEYLGKVDLLITSPPYATALPYLDTDRLSLIVLGLLPRKDHKAAESLMVGTREISERQRKEAWEDYLLRKSELPRNVASLIERLAKHYHSDAVGFRRRNLPALLGRYYLDMLDAMRSARSLMAEGAFGFYVVGNNSTVVGDLKIDIPTDQFLYDIGEAAGWHKYENIPMELLVSRDIFKDNRGSSEAILVFKA